jgi:hypothetical protein
MFELAVFLLQFYSVPLTLPLCNSLPWIELRYKFKLVGFRVSKDILFEIGSRNSTIIAPFSKWIRRILLRIIKKDVETNRGGGEKE